MRTPTLIAAVTAALLAGPAWAHPAVFHGTGIAVGLMHPFMGMDHLLAMLAVGLWAAQQQDVSTRWRIALALLAVMAIGAFLGMLGLALPGVEAGIAASVLVLGLCVAFALRLHANLAMALIGVFALFHGHAHGMEIAHLDAPYAYAGGLLLATALLHGAGLLGGLALRRHGDGLLRLGGAAVALVGLGLSLS